MSALDSQHTELNPIQISLLRLFNRPMSIEETSRLKKILVEHYTQELHEEVSQVVTKKGYTQDDFDKMLNGDD